MAKRDDMAKLGSQRALKWGKQNLDQDQCQELADGAARRMNTNNHMEFESGNWKGQRL